MVSGVPDQDRARFRGKIQTVIDAEVYRNSTGELVAGKS
jgi:hypothetical protein